MCGIAGFWSARARPGDERTVYGMCEAIRHRGPDSEGVWHDAEAGVFLGHRRLAIIDLSEAGHQPMRSACGRFTLVYNGEIYNHPSLREELERAGAAPAWRGHSDTETLLAAISHWGFETTLRRLNGMFAIAVWDARERTLLLARDRLGEKPLYYGQLGDTFIFGSEIKALREHPLWVGEIDRESIAQYLRFSAVPAPFSAYRGIAKLPPAHWIAIREARLGDAQVQPYWDLETIAMRGVADADENVPDAELLDTLEQRLLEAVALRTIADVPLGAFLSGGIDSSLVVALMQKRATTPVETFTIGFDRPEYNEAHHAKAVAAHLGTRHTELYVDERQALDLVPELPRIWDEPFADASQIPTLLVSRLTRESVTVSLSGDGGDELFHGYSRYAQTEALWRSVRRLPAAVRAPLGTLAGRFARRLAMRHDRLAGGGSETLRRQLARLDSVGLLFASRNFDDFYRTMISTDRNPPTVGPSGAARPLPAYAHPDLQRAQDRMMYADTRHYLPDTVLTKVDRASMAASLESRAPLLDHTLVEHAWSLPLRAKHRDGIDKWALRQVLYRHVPAGLVERPKMGFGVPIDHWLRGELREWAATLLEPRRLDEQGLLDGATVAHLFDEHVRGRANHQFRLWNILMLQAWILQGEK